MSAPAAQWPPFNESLQLSLLRRGYPSIPEKAAAYGFFIAEAQVFIDGNKRTAVIALEAFLLLNGYEFRMSDGEIAELFEELGSDKIGQGEFFDAISTHARLSNPEHEESP